MDERKQGLEPARPTPRRPRSEQRPLTALDVRRRRPGLHQDGEVAGLYLRVTDTGARGFLLRFMVAGRRRDMWLGSTSELDLAGARAKAREHRLQIKEGFDPIEERKKLRRQNRIAQGLAEWTFEKAAREVHGNLLSGWKNPKHGDQWINTLATYAFPKIGETPVGELGVEAVAGVLKPIWTTKAETARRVRQRIGAVMDWAVAHGYAKQNPVDAVTVDTQVLPKQRDKVEHHAAMPYADVPAFLRSLQVLDASSSRLALEFAILTAARSGEVRGATWSEIDTKAATWTVPAERMKREREHRVPLSKQALAVLKTAAKRAGKTEPDAPLFPNPYGKPLSDMALTQLMRGLERTETVHGFRSSFRDWCAEHEVPDALAERALAHAVKDPTEAAYHRTEQLEQRRPLMAKWGAFVGSAK